MPTVFAIIFFLAAHLQAIELMLYYSSSCPYSRKVLRYLDSIDKTIPMKDVSRNSQAKKELKEMGGEKLVPCLCIDKKPLYDTAAIIEWLSSHREDF